MRTCFKFTAVAAAAAAPAQATLSIFDEIGFWGVQAKDFIKELGAVSAKTINVEINSPGGDVFAGLAIYNALKGSGKEIVVKVMGVAASAASLIAMAGDKIVMPKNTFMMVHNPWSFAMGNADELRETANTLDKIGDSLQATYVARSGQTPEKVKELLSKDTWLTADEALELGFATEVVDDVKANAAFDMDRADLPERVRAVFKAAIVPVDPTEDPVVEDPVVEDPVVEDPVVEDPAETPVADQVSALAVSAGLGDYASVFALSATTLEDAKARIGSAREIVALAKVAGRPDDAKAAIGANTSVSDFRAALIKAKAEADQHTDTSRPADPPPKAGGKPAAQVYKERADKRAARRNKATR